MSSSIVFWISLLLSLYSLTTGSPLWDAENEIENRLELENFEARFYSQLEKQIQTAHWKSEEIDRGRLMNNRDVTSSQVCQMTSADRPDLRQAMYAKYGRVAIMATNEVTQNIPEHSFLPPFWNTRARGLGGTLQIPVSTGAEENVLCLRSDGYREDIFLHEFAHGIHKIALTTAVAGFNSRLTNAYNSARRRGLWQNTYADDTVDEYFAEGVQSFFNVESPPVFGIHNDIDTREELAAYDPTLYNLIREAFPCMNNIVDRCQNQGQISSQPLRMNCAGTNTGGSGGRPGNQCEDRNQFCPSWATRGECQRNPAYMLPNCPLSCNQCQG
ncbi:hypothetical protein BSL78_06371 [Apostichopus japonicus]|uniref:ShKT domain-containing protein n=1 Tax=Stichopus japonicus TaxID=307972 RepID=A0A2G8L900_STIJA|nr:hypothetical protein BSL78_06371 [Apostichopus japonicus]